MNSEAKICYPSLDLFLYHLKDALGEGPEKIQQNHDLFWNNLPPEITVSLEKEEAAAGKSFLKLLKLTSNAAYYPLTTEQINGYKIGGYYYPVLLNDAYSLLLDCCVDDEYSAEPVKSFSTLKNVISEKEGDLGKVWMISGYLNSDSATTEEIAKAAYQQLMGREAPRVETGKFLGADVFEFWQLEQPKSWQSILSTEVDNSPAIAIICPDKETMDKNSYFYQDWLELFCSRQKIFWAYSQCRQHSKNLQKQLSWINQTIQKITDAELDWSQLKYSLKLCADYVILLEQMKIDNSAITDNLHNYQNQLKVIIKDASDKGETNLKFLEQFSEDVGRYQHQNEQDISKFEACLSILENLRETVKSLVDIEQAQSDRQFQKNIEVMAFGIGLASVVASSSSAYIGAIEEIPPVEKYLNIWQLNPQQSSLVVAVNAAMLTGAIASLLIASFFSRNQNRKKTGPRHR